MNVATTRIATNTLLDATPTNLIHTVNGTFTDVNNNSKSIYSSNIVMTVMTRYTITPRSGTIFTTASPLKMMENAFYFTFTLKALFFLKICKFLSCLFGHVEKRLD